MSIISGGGAVVGAGAAAGGYQIARSLRFNFADSTYLNRTPASATNRTTWTYSYWFKSMMLKPGVNDYWAFSAFNDGSNYTAIRHHEQYYIDVISFNAGSAVSIVKTQQVFRDPSAWNHMVIVFDTGNATQSDRVRIYHNGIRADIRSGATYPGSGSPTGWVNSTSVHYIGRISTEYFDGYLTEINFIDGQALTPSSFGEYNTDTGVWQPIEYTGSYGTNGFYLNFSDNASTTTLGNDSSGNGNNWTPNNFSVTAGAGNDSLVDTPTNYGTDTGVGGEVRGNYCTLNPLRNTDPGNGTITNGNLQVNGTQGAVNCTAAGTMMLAGKMYWEFTVNTMANSGTGVGIVPITNFVANSAGSQATGIYYLGNGNKRVTGTTTAYGSTYTSGDVIGIAVDVDAETITFYKNNVSQGSISGTGVIASGVLPYIGMDDSNSPSVTANFGQRPFAYTAPSGFKALCTQNLPTPTIEDGEDYFNTVLWTGTGSGTTRAITGVGFQPDWVWAKSRSNSYSHSLYDVIRGGGANAELQANSTAAEGGSNNDQYGYLSSFDSDGFTSTAGTQGAANNFYFNQSGVTYVAWNWKANGAGSSNTAGNITSTVSVNTTSGFSIVAYTGTGTSGRTVGHGLGVTPGMIFVKSRSASGAWIVWQQTLPGIGWNLYLQTTDSQQNDNQFTGAINSTTFGIHASGGSTNQSGVTYIAYCFAPVAGYSAFGSYTGNGLDNGPYIFTNFRPAFVMIKRATSGISSGWLMYDDKRSTYNVVGNVLEANESAAEGVDVSTRYIDFLSNGFKLRTFASALNYSDGGTYIYMAFAENPFKYALAR